MRFRPALPLLLLCATAPAAVCAQEARVVELGYEITFAGFAGFRLDVAARLDGQTYDVETSTFKEGMLRALTIHYAGRNRAWGILAKDGGNPIGGSFSIVVGDKARTFLAGFPGDGSVNETNNPEWKPPPEAKIAPEQIRGSFDPLNAGLVAAFAGDGACDRTIRSYDGKRRIDIILKKVGTEPASAIGVPGVEGDALICELYTKRIAGEFDTSPKEAEAEEQRPMRLWLARLGPSPIRFPVKLEAQTGFGTIRGKTLVYSQRPLTDEDRAKMRR